MAANDLCTLEDVRLALRLQSTDTADDLRIGQAIESATGRILDHLGREVVLNTSSAARTEYHDGDGGAFFRPEEWPVISVTSLHDSTDRAYDSGDLLTENTHFLVYSDHYQARVERIEGAVVDILTGSDSASFARGQRNIKLVYVPGYASRGDLPRAFVSSCIRETIADLVRTRFAGITRDQVADLVQDFRTTAFQPETVRQLRIYKGVAGW